MRSLVLTHNYPRYVGDPVGSFVLRLAVSLRDQGIESHVIAPAAPEVPMTDVIEGVPVTRFRYAPRRLETLAYTGTMGAQVQQFWKARLAMAGFLVAGYRTAMKVNERFRADVVHAHWWFPGGLVARVIRARAGIPFVVTMHGSDIRLAAHARGAAALFRTVSSRASAITTVSSWLARQARTLDPAVAPEVAPMPVVSGLFHAGGSRAADTILFVGKLTEQKGLHHLLRAMTLMKSQPRLEVVGAGRVDDHAVRALAVQLGLDDRITWHPLLSQDELATRYRACAVHVIPAIDEGLGMTAVEALLSETPVVAFDSGGIPDVVIPERTGLLVRPGDVAALATSVDRVLLDGALRARLGAGGREFALTRFGAETVGRAYAALLQRAAAAHR